MNRGWNHTTKRRYPYSGHPDITRSRIIYRGQKNLAKRVERAHVADRNLPVKLDQALYRPTEMSLQFIRWLRIGLTRPTCFRRAIEQVRFLMLVYL